MKFLKLKYFLILLPCLLSSVNAEYIEVDTDGDGVPDQFGEDYDGDGIIDDIGWGQDWDGDGIPDEGWDIGWQDLDGDGIPDEGIFNLIDIYDFDGDGTYEIYGNDDDFDHQIESALVKNT